MASKSLKSITVLKLKLDLSDEQKELLTDVAKLCRKARNAALENWLLRKRGLPETEKQAKPSRKNVGEGLKESTKIYHAVRLAAPTLNTAMVSMIANGIDSNLRSKLDWRKQPGAVDGGEKPKKAVRADAILAYDDRPPFFTKFEIPIRSAISSFTFVEWPELSTPFYVGAKVDLKLRTSQLKGGHKRLLHELAAGTRKLSDSRIVEKDGEWFWHVPIMFETVVRSEIEATLWPVFDAKSSRPFDMDLPGDRTWGIGDGRYYIGQATRFIALRKAIGWRYKQRSGAGHGRKKIDDAMRKRWCQWQCIATEFRRRAINDVVKQCVRGNIGTLIYREPSLVVREKSWFDLNGLDWDWTRFLGDLTNAAARQGIDVVKRPLKLKEYKGNEPSPATV